jgi:hypothetical protein
MKNLFPVITVLMIVVALQTSPQTIDCPPWGSAKSERLKTLNIKKNRIEFPNPADIDSSATIERILVPGDDKTRWSEKKAAIVTGYVTEVRMSAAESCNCFSKEKENRDTHIEIVMDPMNPAKNKCMVVEVTPRIRNIMAARGIDWSSKMLRKTLLGRWVKFTGWMLFDIEHSDEAENTKPGRTRNWRGTAWEIHPITDIQVLNPRKPMNLK